MKGGGQRPPAPARGISSRKKKQTLRSTNFGSGEKGWGAEVDDVGVEKGGEGGNDHRCARGIAR